MPSTATWGLHYPALTDLADVPSDMATLANDVDTKLTQVTVDFVPPIGSMFMWVGNFAPTHYLLCEGQSLDRTVYDALFDLLGTTYGSADSTHFNLPDLRGRVAVGVDGAAARLASNDALAQTGGEEKHTLSTAELASHAHTFVAPGVATAGGFGPLTASPAGGGSPATWPYAPSGSISTLSMNNTGSSTPHNNMPPYIILHYIIRFE